MTQPVPQSVGGRAVRVLILGGAGMLGHKVWQSFRDRFDAWVTLRGRAADYAGLGLFDPERTIDGVDGARPEDLARAMSVARPDVVINCIGVVKQRPEGKDPIVSLTINALLPHRVAALCRAAGARLVHVSTDCVFSGRTGGYREEDAPDAADLYGRSKLLGEPHEADPDALTLRTSIVGRELRAASGVTEWFLSHRGGTVPGYTRAVFSGLTTQALAGLLGDLVARPAPLRGLYHVSSAPITKFELLQRLDSAYRAGVRIEPSDGVVIDRSLDSTRFWQATGFARPDWDRMMKAAAADPTPYDDWRTVHVP
jgi:dTDP-4-dehydrorhamnose reductase